MQIIATTIYGKIICELYDKKVERQEKNMIISHASKSVRYTGRWKVGNEAAVTTAPGAMFEMAFKGCNCVLMFDVNMNAEPFPHVYIQLDNGARIEVSIDHYIRVEASENGNHILKVIYKSAMEMQPRWYEPLVGKVSFIGAEADGEGDLPAENKKIMEFIGDSITEGIWVDEGRAPHKYYQKNMVFENDATATYACKTAETLGMRPYIMGYGAVGITKAGKGGVPKVYEAYPFCFNNTPINSSGADVVVINHGANDQLASAQEYVCGYREFLDLVRSRNPAAKIVVLSPFCGAFHTELGRMVQQYNVENTENVIYIDTFGWIPEEPLHPAREGHKVVADKLIKKLKEVLE